MKIFLCASIGTIALGLSACNQTPSYQKIEGQTMGTSYHINFKAPKNADLTAIKQSIDDRLLAINKSMSTYDKDSTISKFNTLKARQSITIDADFIQVLGDSRTIYEKSNHSFDPTVYPLVELWGFGSQVKVERLQNPPSADEIRAIKDTIGLDKVVLNGDKLSKTHDGVGLDFSAIAKGYGVDVIAQTLKNTYQINDYMVEIGGEVATLGVNPQGKSWTLAIDRPDIGSTATNRQIATTVSSQGGKPLHIATSGNYRNMLQYEGVIYSHTINPNSARPVENGAPSVSVIHDSTALADGWATALSAVPYQQALILANQHKINAIFIHQQNNQWQIQYSNAYQQNFVKR